MRYLVVIAFLFFGNWGFAQPETEAEEEIFAVATEMPRFPVCEKLEGSIEEKKECANAQLMRFIAGNVVYPDSARMEGVEGKVVVRFVVEKDGSISNAQILRDIGGGCGDEVLRVINAMNEIPVRWVPGKQMDKIVRTYFTMNVPFKLQEAPPEPDFIMVEGDSVYVKYEEAPDFKGGQEALMAFIKENLSYPKSGEANCMMGAVEVNILIGSDETIKVLDITDYSKLGLSYEFEAIDVVNKSAGKWKPAVFKGRKVNASYTVRMTFQPSSTACAQRLADFEQAQGWINEGLTLYEEEKREEAIAKFSQALDLFPNNSEYLAYRGQAYLDSNQMEMACSDLSRVKDILLVSWYDQLLPLICK